MDREAFNTLDFFRIHRSGIRTDTLKFYAKARTSRAIHVPLSF